MFVSIGVCALRVVNTSATTAFRGKVIAVTCALAIVASCGQSAGAQVVQDFYEAPFATSTGVFEWDDFTTTFGPAPDFKATGIGSATLDLMSIAQPGDVPPLALVTSTGNIYTGGTLTNFTVGLSGLNMTEAHTTVVMQLSALGSFSGFEINGQAPTEFVELGTVEDVLHGSGSAPFDTTFYWTLWQLDSSTDFEITFANSVTHQSLTGIRVDYFNSASPINVTAPNVLSSSTLLGDVNLDSTVDFLDISPFISLLSTSDFQAEGDIDGNGDVDFLDIAGFIAILSGS